MADANNKAEKIAAARKKLKEFQQKTHKSVIKSPIKEKNDESNLSEEYYINNKESDASSTCDFQSENNKNITFFPPSVNLNIDSNLSNQPEWSPIDAELDFHKFNTVNLSPIFNDNTESLIDSNLNEIEQSLKEPSASDYLESHIKGNIKDTGLQENSFFDHYVEKNDNETDCNNISDSIQNNTLGNSNNYRTDGSSVQSYFSENQNDFVLKAGSVQNLPENSLQSNESLSVNNLKQSPTMQSNYSYKDNEQFEILKEFPDTVRNCSVNQVEGSTVKIPIESTNTNDTYMLSNVENIRQLSSQLQQFIDPNSTPAHTSTFHLEQRNQELDALLKKEQLDSQQLRVTLEEYKNKITRLENDLKKTHEQYEIRLNEELNPLREQLQYHVQTIGLLVGEKTELMSALEKSQSLAKEKVSECEELHGRLKASRYRVVDLEKELTSLKNSQANNTVENLYQKQIESVQLENDILKQQLDELKQDTSELTQKYETKVNECVNVHQLLQDKSSQLSLSQLKIQQLSSIENSDLEKQFEVLNKDKIYLETRVAELIENIKSSNVERDKANHQYQQYVIQLNGQMQNMSNQIENLTKENESLVKREKTLILHVGDMEKELQSLRAAKKTVTIPNENHQMEIHSLKEMFDNSSETIKLLTEEKKILEENIIEKEKKILELENYVETVKEDTPNIAKLMQSIESDKVAAAQAIQQNSKLMQQIKELQDEHIKINNMKLDLMQKFESEQHLGHEILQQLKHCENELENMKDIIKLKENKILELENKMYEPNSSVNISADNETTLETQSIVSSQKEVPNENDHDEIVQIPTNSSNEEKCSTYIEKAQAMKQLEERFTRTMKEIAELTEEKQRLEHLVLQLQDETETIGEYIALYQHQRGILKQRSIEKDEQLRILNNDREELKTKLNELNYYIKEFLTFGKPELLNEYKKLNNEEIENLTTNNVETQINIKINDELKTETVGKIVQLLSEINKSNLVEPKEVKGIEGFHPCPLCSGQLINV